MCSKKNLKHRQHKRSGTFFIHSFSQDSDSQLQANGHKSGNIYLQLLLFFPQHSLTEQLFFCYYLPVKFLLQNFKLPVLLHRNPALRRAAMLLLSFKGPRAHVWWPDRCLQKKAPSNLVWGEFSSTWWSSCTNYTRIYILY